MNSVESKKALLASAISGEVGKLADKFSFWHADVQPNQTLWQSSQPLSLESILASIDPEEDLLGLADFALLYGLGWEFVWGQKPPEIVSQLRAETIQKARDGAPLNELEYLWYQIICVDTDMF